MAETIKISKEAVLTCNECGGQSWVVHLDQAGEVVAFACANAVCQQVIEMQLDEDDDGILLEPTFGPRPVTR